ncbi:MAG: hypothetical protein Q8S04_04070 [Bacteroidales bacterium]|nr:hypothetical protein [Bacteroidales bacterium]
MSKLKYLLTIFIVLISVTGIRAQIILKSYFDIGENNASEGVFVKSVYRVNYQYLKFNIETGMQFNLISNNPNTITGLDILGSTDFLVRKFPLSAKGYFMLNRFSDLMYETNWGVGIETRKFEHFLFELGTNFKTYRFNSGAINKYNISKDKSKLRENFNLRYVISAYLKPHYNDWNLGLSCTNVDYYVINQSTNPVFNFQTTFKIKSNLTVYLDLWYKQAGMLNINAYYFGYFFRGGVIWKI